VNDCRGSCSERLIEKRQRLFEKSLSRYLTVLVGILPSWEVLHFLAFGLSPLYNSSFPLDIPQYKHPGTFEKSSRKVVLQSRA